jgi:uncharacterized protein (UPF0333 family)
MLKERKKGQIQISFGMIFSIIIIIATVAVAFYVINYFMKMSECTKAGSFVSSLKNEVEKAYNGDITKGPFTKEVPSGVKYVCFGNANQTYTKADSEQHDYIDKYSITNNVLLYPPGKACDNELASFNLAHATTGTFFCVPVKSGKATVMLEKGSFDVFVKLSKP